MLKSPDLRRLLDIAHPLAIYVPGADVEAVAVQNEPDRDFVRLPVLHRLARVASPETSR